MGLVNFQAEFEGYDDIAQREMHSTFHAGDFFGEQCLACLAPHTMTVRTTTHADCFRLTRESFEEALDKFPHVKNIVQERERKRFGKIIDQMHMRRSRGLSIMRSSNASQLAPFPTPTRGREVITASTPAVQSEREPTNLPRLGVRQSASDDSTPV